MPSIPIVGKRLGLHELPGYLSLLDLSAWRPEYLVLHHTASPSLADRPHGFLGEHMRNLAEYYGGLGWHAGPHGFIDDQGGGTLWIFSPMTAPGVHAKSFNRYSWGFEMLGDFDSEAFDSGRGAQVRDAAAYVLAACLRRLGLPCTSETIRFHREDPKTAKSCPGKLVEKAEILARVQRALTPEWRCVLPLGEYRAPEVGGRPCAPAREFLGALVGALPAGELQWVPMTRELRLAGRSITGAWEREGRAWAPVRGLAEAAGFTVLADTAARTVTVRKAPVG